MEKAVDLNDNKKLKFVVTKHALLRLKQRFNISNPSAALRLCRRAVREGMVAAEGDRALRVCYGELDLVCVRKNDKIIVKTALKSSWTFDWWENAIGRGRIRLGLQVSKVYLPWGGITSAR